MLSYSFFINEAKTLSTLVDGTIDDCVKLIVNNIIDKDILLCARETTRYLHTVLDLNPHEYKTKIIGELANIIKPDENSDMRLEFAQNSDMRLEFIELTLDPRYEFTIRKNINATFKKKISPELYNKMSKVFDIVYTLCSIYEFPGNNFKNAGKLCFLSWTMVFNMYDDSEKKNVYKYLAKHKDQYNITDKWLEENKFYLRSSNVGLLDMSIKEAVKIGQREINILKYFKIFKDNPISFEEYNITKSDVFNFGHLLKDILVNRNVKIQCTVGYGRNNYSEKAGKIKDVFLWTTGGKPFKMEISFVDDSYKYYVDIHSPIILFNKMSELEQKFNIINRSSKVGLLDMSIKESYRDDNGNYIHSLLHCGESKETLYDYLEIHSAEEIVVDLIKVLGGSTSVMIDNAAKRHDKQVKDAVYAHTHRTPNTHWRFVNLISFLSLNFEMWVSEYNKIITLKYDKTTYDLTQKDSKEYYNKLHTVIDWFQQLFKKQPGLDEIITKIVKSRGEMYKAWLKLYNMVNDSRFLAEPHLPGNNKILQNYIKKSYMFADSFIDYVTYTPKELVDKMDTKEQLEYINWLDTYDLWTPELKKEFQHTIRSDKTGLLDMKTERHKVEYWQYDTGDLVLYQNYLYTISDTNDYHNKNRFYWISDLISSTNDPRHYRVSEDYLTYIDIYDEKSVSEFILKYPNLVDDFFGLLEFRAKKSFSYKLLIKRYTYLKRGNKSGLLNMVKESNDELNKQIRQAVNDVTYFDDSTLYADIDECPFATQLALIHQKDYIEEVKNTASDLDAMQLMSNTFSNISLEEFTKAYNELLATAPKEILAWLEDDPNLYVKWKNYIPDEVDVNIPKHLKRSAKTNLWNFDQFVKENWNPIPKGLDPFPFQIGQMVKCIDTEGDLSLVLIKGEEYEVSNCRSTFGFDQIQVLGDEINWWDVNRFAETRSKITGLWDMKTESHSYENTKTEEFYSIFNNPTEQEDKWTKKQSERIAIVLEVPEWFKDDFLALYFMYAQKSEWFKDRLGISDKTRYSPHRPSNWGDASDSNWAILPSAKLLKTHIKKEIVKKISQEIDNVMKFSDFNDFFDINFPQGFPGKYFKATSKYDTVNHKLRHTIYDASALAYTMMVIYNAIAKNLPTWAKRSKNANLMDMVKENESMYMDWNKLQHLKNEITNKLSLSELYDIASAHDLELVMLELLDDGEYDKVRYYYELGYDIKPVITKTILNANKIRKTVIDKGWAGINDIKVSDFNIDDDFAEFFISLDISYINMIANYLSPELKEKYKNDVRANDSGLLNLKESAAEIDNPCTKIDVSDPIVQKKSDILSKIMIVRPDEVSKEIFNIINEDHILMIMTFDKLHGSEIYNLIGRHIQTVKNANQSTSIKGNKYSTFEFKDESKFTVEELYDYYQDVIACFKYDLERILKEDQAGVASAYPVFKFIFDLPDNMDYLSRANKSGLWDMTTENKHLNPYSRKYKSQTIHKQWILEDLEKYSKEKTERETLTYYAKLLFEGDLDGIEVVLDNEDRLHLPKFITKRTFDYYIKDMYWHHRANFLKQKVVNFLIEKDPAYFNIIKNYIHSKSKLKLSPEFRRGSASSLWDFNTFVKEI